MIWSVITLCEPVPLLLGFVYVQWNHIQISSHFKHLGQDLEI